MRTYDPFIALPPKSFFAVPPSYLPPLDYVPPQKPAAKRPRKTKVRK